MKALTLHQPWATLVAVGVKTIETRSWSTSYRGPLAIHAGQRPVREVEKVGDWEAWPPDPRGRIHPNHDRERPARVYRNAAPLSPVFGRFTLGLWLPLPFGAVVATCTLVDCAPMGRWDSFRTGIFDGDEGDFPGQHVLVIQPDGALSLDHPGGCRHDCGTYEDVTAQRPYGDYAPGRWAWLLADITPVDPPIPARGRQQLWTWAR